MIMSIRKRWLALLLTAVILAALLVPVSAADEKYTDVTTETLDEDTVSAIHLLTVFDIVNGVGGDRFAPQDTLTRAMFVTMLYRWRGEDEVWTHDFSDVASGRYYNKPVGWAAHYGVVNGYGDGQFRPERAITRQEAITILFRLVAEERVYWHQFLTALDDRPDYADVNAYARQAMSWAEGYGILRGLGERLNPKAPLTRGEAALYVARAMLPPYHFPEPTSYCDSNLQSCIRLGYSNGSPLLLPENGVIYNDAWRGTRLITSWAEYQAFQQEMEDWITREQSVEDSWFTIWQRTTNWGNDPDGPLYGGREIDESFFEHNRLAVAERYFGGMRMNSYLEPLQQENGTVTITIVYDAFVGCVADTIGQIYLIPVGQDCTDLRLKFRRANWYQHYGMEYEDLMGPGFTIG